MYVAVSYIGDEFVPGEIIPDDLPKGQLEWLIRAGAVREKALAPDESPETPEEPETEEPAAESQEPETESEIEEAEEAPEIDIMDGLVAEEEPKPARASRKTTGKAKGGKTK